MSNYRRAVQPGATWFFTVNLLHRSGNDLLVRDIDVLRACVARERVRRPFAIRAFVVLPDHMHWIWTLPDGDADYSTRWRRIKTEFARAQPLGEPRSAVRKKRGERAIWQRRFWEHLVRDETDFRRHVEYIHYNPVKHGWARCVADWAHSSFHHFVERGVYSEDWGAGADIHVGGDD